MAGYEIDVPDRPGPVRVTCTDHGESERFPGESRTVAFHCPDCGVEIEVTLHREDWREYTEWC